jgi:hypothetical protein
MRGAEYVYASFALNVGSRKLDSPSSFALNDVNKEL